MSRPIHDDRPDALRRRLLGASAGAVALSALPGACSRSRPARSTGSDSRARRSRSFWSRARAAIC